MQSPLVEDVENVRNVASEHVIIIVFFIASTHGRAYLDALHNKIYRYTIAHPIYIRNYLYRKPYREINSKIK